MASPPRPTELISGYNRYRYLTDFNPDMAGGEQLPRWRFTAALTMSGLEGKAGLPVAGWAF
jgi:hypothetical protein